MANPEHLKILMQGVEVWNQWRKENSKIRPSFSNAALAELNFNGVNLYKATFKDTDLRWANLSNANLREANLSRTNLNGVNLSKTDLSGATIWRVDLSGANLYKANFSKVDLALSIFGNTDLREVKGLDKVRHSGPSTIGTDTLNHSQGLIPVAFLRGCGLRDWEIETVKLYRSGLTSEKLTTIYYKFHELRIDNPIQYYSCFISYSSKDHAFAQRLHANLQDNGVRCWFAAEDMKIGDKIRYRIDESIRIHDKLLLILSENSLNSFWVESEVEKAFEKERQHGQTVLFPIRLDDTVMKTDQAWAAEIRRTRHIGDFSRWKDHDAYQLAFERLLRDLKAEG